MGFGKEVDPPGGSLWRALKAALLTVLVCAAALPAAGQDTIHQKITEIQTLYDGKQWEAVVTATEDASTGPGDLGLYRGLALSHLQRWEEAEAAFRSSLAANPGDSRLMIELGGLAYRKKDFRAAKGHLRRALAIRDDRYANDLLASIYFLEGNLEAALKYWNRAGKPQLSDLRFQPQPALKPILLDRVFPFRRGSVWAGEQYLTTRRRLAELGVFQSERFDLEANADDSFDLIFQSVQKPAWRDSPWIAGANLLSGLPYLTVYPEFQNLDRAALNWNSMLRWDDQKRRYSSELSGPLRNNPAWGYRVRFDLRNENWNLTNTLVPAQPSFAGVNLERQSVAMDFLDVAHEGWTWSLGPVFAHREFRNPIGLPAGAAPFFTGGSNLGLEGKISRELLRHPERRFAMEGTVSGQAGTFFNNSLGRYSKLNGDLDSRWLPQARGDDYETHVRVRSGGDFGYVPLDELYVLGFDRDTDLWMRGHPGLISGQKGNAPLGREYVLVNSDFDKIVYRAPFVTFRAGPFLDSGRIFDPSSYFAERVWMWDTGVQVKIRVLGSFEFVLGWGKDLRSGRNSFFTTVTPGAVN